jgi:CBS domain-containing protein
VRLARLFITAKNNSLFFDYLGNDAQENSPFLFQNLNVEEDCIKNMFDIKTRAIMPLVDAARLFTLYFDLKGINNTYVRFKQLSSLIPNTRDLNCAEAFDFIKIQDPRRSKNENSGNI